MAWIDPGIPLTTQQAYHRIPMAISLGFGIIFAISIILVIVAGLYLVFEDNKESYKWQSGIVT